MSWESAGHFSKRQVVWAVVALVIMIAGSALLASVEQSREQERRARPPSPTELGCAQVVAPAVNRALAEGSVKSLFPLRDAYGARSLEYRSATDLYLSLKTVNKPPFFRSKPQREATVADALAACSGER